MERKRQGNVTASQSLGILYAKRKKIASIINTTSRVREGCTKRIKQLQRQRDAFAIKSGELYQDARAVKGVNPELSEKLYAEWSATQYVCTSIVEKINRLKHQEYIMSINIAKCREELRTLDREISFREKAAPVRT